MTVYFVKSENFVKIGYSSKPMKRVKALQTANLNRLEVLCFVPGSAAMEKELHSVFSELHHLNEWYRYEGVLVDYVNMSLMIFSDYTTQYETGDVFQDERDWEYWKIRAEQADAENKLLRVPVAKTNNRRNGTGVNVADKRLLIITELETNYDRTNVEIGEVVGVSGQYVGRIRGKLNGSVTHG